MCMSGVGEEGESDFQDRGSLEPFILKVEMG